jgi:general transcription factor IIIA
MLRHVARVHGRTTVEPAEEEEATDVDADEPADKDEDGAEERAAPVPTSTKRRATHGPPPTGQPSSLIDDITGHTYAVSAGVRKLACPFPSLNGLAVTLPSATASSTTSMYVEDSSSAGAALPVRACAYVFGRAYDLRRHLRAVHGVEVDKDVLDAWAKARTSA